MVATSLGIRVCGVVFLVLGACDPNGVVGSYRSAIVGGDESPTDAEVFMISFRVLGIPNMCSATLIGARTLVTAAHCLDTRFYPAGSLIRFRATNLSHARQATAADEIEIIETRLHPDYGFSYSPNDIALALLARPPGGVSPKPWSDQPAEPLLGAPVRVLGYGYTDPEDDWSFGTRHSVDLAVRAVDASFLTVGDQVARGFCSGDSGGPSFHLFSDGVERVVGVHVLGETCTDGQDVRIDAHADFIREWLNEKEGPGVVVDAGTVGLEPLDASGPDLATAEDAMSADALPDSTADQDPPVDGTPELRGDAGAPHASAPTDAQPEDGVRVLREVSSCQTTPGGPVDFALLFLLAAAIFAGRRRGSDAQHQRSRSN